jgi:hypothetical protein
MEAGPRCTSEVKYLNGKRELMSEEMGRRGREEMVQQGSHEEMGQWDGRGVRKTKGRSARERHR